MNFSLIVGVILIVLAFLVAFGVFAPHLVTVEVGVILLLANNALDRA